MTRTACIQFPANEPLLMIRKSYMAICEGNTCAAGLLAVFQYWHENKLAHRGQAKAHNDALEAEGKKPTQTTSLWVYKSKEELRADLMDIYAETSIGAALKYLTDKGFVERRSNPKLKWDKKPQYLFQVAAVQAAIDNVQSINQNHSIDEAVSQDRPAENKRALPEIQSEDQPETPTESLAPGGAVTGKRVKKPAAVTEQTETPIPSSGAPLSADKPKQTTELKNAIAILCKGTVDAWKIESVKTSLSKALREILEIEPGLTVQRLREFYTWWNAYDFRGRKGEKPQPHLLPSIWIDFMQKDMNDGSQAGTIFTQPGTNSTASTASSPTQARTRRPGVPSIVNIHGQGPGIKTS